MRMRNLLRAAPIPLVASLTLLGSFLMVPSAAKAATWDCAGYSNWLAAHWSPPSRQIHWEEGTLAQIRYEGVVLCGSDQSTNSQASGWDMIQDPNSQYGYMQTGFLYASGWPCAYHFSQQRQNASSPFYTMTGSCVGAGEVHNGVQYVWADSSGAWHGATQIDNTPFQTIGWNPFTNWSRPFASTFASEVTHPGSDFPGTPGTPTYFNALWVQDWNTNNWVPLGQNSSLTYAGPGLQKGSSTSDGTTYVNDWTNNPNINY